MRRASLALTLALTTACTKPTPELAGETAEASRRYPDLFSLYAGDQGIYRGCGPSGGVCHNGNEFPNMDSLGSILDNIDRDCNLKRQDATTIHDLCERAGDRLSGGGASGEIAWIELADAAARRWRVHLREPAPVSGAEIEVRRGDHTLYDLAEFSVTAEPDPDDAGGSTVLLTVPVPPPVTEDDEAPLDFGAVLMRSGAPGDPGVVQVSDPNRNGIYGGELGGKIIKPGDPARSYLIARLTDPSAGPLMPRANCCHWSKPALRAFYCWVEGLAADGSNAMSKIDYAGCSPGPSVVLLYPEIGPECEAMGRCPVEAADPGDAEPTFHNVYAQILMPTCSGAECHGAAMMAGLDFAREDRAYETLASKVVAGDPVESVLYQRISPDLCVAPECLTMPLGQEPLSQAERDLIRRWIEMGADR